MKAAALAGLALAGFVLGCAATSRDTSPDAAAASAVAPWASLDPGAGRPDHVLLVSVTGLTPEAYAASGPMPLLAQLAAAGAAAARVEAVTPSAAYPVHTSLVTGRSPREHGIPADHLLGERGVRRELYSHASLVRGATLWERVGQARGEVAALDWPATLGAGIPVLLPDLVPQRGQRYRALLSGSTTPWLLELLASSPTDVSVPGPGRDAFLRAAACAVMASPTPPRLLLLRLSQTGPSLRRHGPDTPESAAAFTRVDREIAALLGCLAQAERLASAALVVVGDGAFLPVHTAVRPNALLAEAGFLERSRSGVVESWSAVARSNGGSAFVYARDAEAALAARRTLGDAAASTGAFRLVAAEEMIARRADPEAWFALEARPGFVLLDGDRGPLLAPAPQRGASGYLDAEVPPGFVAFGRGLRRRLRIPVLDQLDVAPTIAGLLGVELPAAEGHALVGLLRDPQGVAAGPGDGDPDWSDGSGEP